MPDIDIMKLQHLKRSIGYYGNITLIEYYNLPTGVYDKTSISIEDGSMFLILDIGIRNFKDRTFLIFERARKEFVDSMDTVLSWFTDPSKKDLFYMDENENLMLNTSYRDLHMIVREARKDQRILQFAPGLMVDSIGKRHEGINITINNMESIAQISYPDFIALRNLINNINYQDESHRFLVDYEFILKTRRLHMADWLALTPDGRVALIDGDSSVNNLQKNPSNPFGMKI